MTGTQPSLAADWPFDPRRGCVRAAAPDAEQLSFDWPLPVRLGPEDFFVSPANADAHALLTAELRWPEGKLALVGPAGSGKTHLARIWAARCGAARLAAAELAADAPLPPAGARLALEDLERLPPAAETALLHLHNHLLATGGRLLLTSDRPPARWGTRLPDLASRLAATAVVRLLPPDDALLSALLAKQFADRQLFPAPEILAYVARRIERSHAAAARAVAALDRAALTGARQLSLALARSVLDELP